MSILAVAVIVIPMLTVMIRLARLGHVFLGLDLALSDLRVRSALHFRETLGPFDRFGWKHPGPVYFYVLSAVHRVIGDGGRTEFIGACLINVAASLGAIWVVRRHAGRWAALWAAVCIGLLALGESSVAQNITQSTVSPIGVSISPWNPYVVLFPLILFGVLCATGSAGSWASLLGAAVVGTFTVQTDIATTPIVVVFLVASIVAAVVRARHSASRMPWRTIAVGSGVTVLLWLPPIIQELTSTPGNFTRIWRFFTQHSGDHSLAAGYKLVLAADQYLLGVPYQESFLPLVSNVHAVVILGVVLIVAVASIGLGFRLGVPLATAMGVASLLGLGVGGYAVANIYGFVFPYDVQWEISAPMLAVMGVGIAVFRSPPKDFAKVMLSAAAAALLVFFSVQMIRLPVAQASDPDVAAAWHIVAPHLPHNNEYVYVNYLGPVDQGDMLFGLLDELTIRGYRPRVNVFWINAVGHDFVTHRTEPLSIVMYRRLRVVEGIPGYVGHTGAVDFVITGPSA